MSKCINASRFTSDEALIQATGVSAYQVVDIRVTGR